MTSQRVLVIRPDGTVSTVYSDKLPLRALGRIRTIRASNVEFDEERQLWVARAVDGRVLAEGPNRSEVVEMEIEVLQEAL